MKKKKLSILASFNLSFHWFAMGIIIPIMTLFLLEKGLTLLQIGAAFAVYSTAAVLLELPTGGLADSIGRKKVYLLSLFLQLLGGAAIVFLNSYTGILFCMALQGTSRSLSSGTMDAYFIDEFYKIDPEINLQKELARIGIFVPLALGIGSLLGGFLPMTLGRVTENSFLHSLYSANYICYAAVLMIQFITTSFLIIEDKKTDEHDNNTIAAGIRKVPEVLRTSINYGIKHPVILLLLLAGFAWGFSISGLEQLWQPQVKSIVRDSMGSWIFGVLTFGYFIAASLGNVLATPLCKLFKANYPIVLFLSRLIMGILYCILAFQNGIVLFSFFYITLFMFNGIQGSPESSIFNKEVSSDKRSTLISFSSLFMQAGGIFGSVLLGFIAQTFSIRTAWIAASIVITASALLYLGVPTAARKKASIASGASRASGREGDAEE
ncbi:MAG: MFS transporter [Spirochaetia bacterium]|nr:MFS transporter [Spirochaetia bacterium]